MGSVLEQNDSSITIKGVMIKGGQQTSGTWKINMPDYIKYEDKYTNFTIYKSAKFSLLTEPSICRSLYSLSVDKEHFSITYILSYLPYLLVLQVWHSEIFIVNRNS